MAAPAVGGASGSMLVIYGHLHPMFCLDLGLRKIRNGVGVARDGTRVYLVISDQPAAFDSLALVFEKHLGTPSALFLDGSISQMIAPNSRVSGSRRPGRSLLWRAAGSAALCATGNIAQAGNRGRTPAL